MKRFTKLLAMHSDIQEHLGLLRGLAMECKTVVEFGFRTGISTGAFLAAGCHVTSYDVSPCKPHSDNLKKAYPGKFRFEWQSSLKASIPECDILFIDSKHDYDVLSKELQLHASKVKKLIILHDTATFGKKGQTKGDKGLQRAVDEMLSGNEFWKLKLHLRNCNGITVLERVA